MTSITPSLKVASKICGEQLADFITFIEQVDPELERYQATMVAAQILNQLQDEFKNNPNMLNDLKKACHITRGLKEIF